MVMTAVMCVANIEPAIALKDVSKRFGATQALDKVSIAIRPGEVHGLVGENGAGKSTLINILGGEIQPDAGEILLHGHHVRWRDPHHASTNGISVVHQELSHSVRRRSIGRAGDCAAVLCQIACSCI